jgi:hypothetical protein
VRFLQGIGYVNSADLLRKAVNSVRSLWSATYIIDNSRDGLYPTQWPVAVVRPPVPLTVSQTINLLASMGEQSGVDVVFWMHNDAEAADGTCERLLGIAEGALAAGRTWGAAFTNYDCLAAFNTSAMRYVGPWDVCLPQYFADADYYRRIRLAGYELLETGLTVHHHNNARSTIRADGGLAYLNAATLPLYRQYYCAKWGGPPHQETLDWAFDGLQTNAYVQGLRGETLYRQLAGQHQSRQRSLLENADDRTLAAQFDTLRSEVAWSRARRVLETGTNKAMLGYCLSRFATGITLFTFDRDPLCIGAVEILNRSQASVQGIFTPGDTKQTLPDFVETDIDLAWIHGDQDLATVSSDIEQAMRLHVKTILLNDVRMMPDIAAAAKNALAAHPEYSKAAVPLSRYDSRGLMVLRRI